MRSVAEHRQYVHSLLRPRPAVELLLAEAAGMVLAEDISADHPLPAFDNSAMDGYAVVAADVATASRESPVRLPVAEDIPAGRVDDLQLTSGTAHRIMTGAPLPRGADAVVQVEATDGGVERVEIFEPRSPGAAIRRAGEDVAAGEVVLQAGQLLGTAQLGLAAALGRATVTVTPPPRVIIVSTGSELVEPGTPLQHGQIYDSNGVMLATAVRQAGAHAEQIHFVTDSVADFLHALRSVLDRADLVLTSGGVSAGAYEVVKDALASRGVDFVKVAMQPGMPQGFGVAGPGRTPVLTMPGNPVSAFVSFCLFGRPALEALQGLPPRPLPARPAELSAPVRSPPGRRSYLRGVLGPDRATVTPLTGQGSHQLGALARANALIVVPEPVTAMAAGQTADVISLP
jgi:molybdopterin molybdotransferase